MYVLSQSFTFPVKQCSLLSLKLASVEQFCYGYMMLSIISYHGTGYTEVSVLCQESTTLTEQRNKSSVEL